MLKLRPARRVADHGLRLLVRTKTYDAIIVGAGKFVFFFGKFFSNFFLLKGHNGLVSACYLQMSGAKVCVLERRHIVGGAAVTEEIVPGFKFSRASYVLSLLRPQIIKDLELKVRVCRDLHIFADIFNPKKKIETRTQSALAKPFVVHANPRSSLVQVPSQIAHPQQQRGVQPEANWAIFVQRRSGYYNSLFF